MDPAAGNSIFSSLPTCVEESGGCAEFRKGSLVETGGRRSLNIVQRFAPSAQDESLSGVFS